MSEAERTERDCRRKNEAWSAMRAASTGGKFAYGGIRLRPFESAQPLYFKIAAGVVHGYKGQYQHKIPFNSSGFAPTATGTVGYCINRFCSELALFGTAALVLTVGVTVP